MAQEHESPQRRHPRIPKLNLVQVARFDEEGNRSDLVVGRTLDLSTGGIRLDLDHDLPPKTVLSVTLALDDKLVEVSGSVVHAQGIEDERYAIGIEFIDLAGEARQLISGYVESLAAVEE